MRLIHTADTEMSRAGILNLLGLVIFLRCFISTPNLLAAEWPWKKLPDSVTATCTLDRDQLTFGFAAALHAKVEASDSKKHPLAYVWSANGGKIRGVGPQVQIDTGGLNPGIYTVEAVAQDAHKNKATCTANFRISTPPDVLTLSCQVAPPAVEQGKEAILEAEGTDSLGHPLHYSWFTNGGTFKGDGPQVSLQTTGLSPGAYIITGRVEDGMGEASDCTTTVRVNAPPPPPPPPPQPENVAEIVFPRNRDTLPPNIQSQLRKVLTRLTEEPTARISVESYAGPDESNPQQLAAARAETVKRYLLDNGVGESRVRTLVGIGGRRGGLRNRTLDIIWLPAGMDY